MKAYFLACSLIIFSSCNFPAKKIAKDANDVNLKVEFDECLKNRYSGKMKVRFYNNSGRSFWISPRHIVFNILRENGSQPSRDMISEEMSRSDKDTFFLPAKDSLAFNITSFSFGDFIFKADSVYYYEASHIKNYTKKVIDSFYPLRADLKATKVSFKICN